MAYSYTSICRLFKESAAHIITGKILKILQKVPRLSADSVLSTAVKAVLKD